MLNKDEFIGYVDAMRRGERARVLFDLLMETIQAPDDVTKGTFFDLMKGVLEREQQAITSVVPPDFKKGKTPRKGVKKVVE